MAAAVVRRHPGRSPSSSRARDPFDKPDLTASASLSDAACLRPRRFPRRWSRASSVRVVRGDAGRDELACPSAGAVARRATSPPRPLALDVGARRARPRRAAALHARGDARGRRRSAGGARAGPAALRRRGEAVGRVRRDRGAPGRARPAGARAQRAATSASASRSEPHRARRRARGRRRAWICACTGTRSISRPRSRRSTRKVAGTADASVLALADARPRA